MCGKARTCPKPALQRAGFSVVSRLSPGLPRFCLRMPLPPPCATHCSPQRARRSSMRLRLCWLPTARRNASANIPAELRTSAKMPTCAYLRFNIAPGPPALPRGIRSIGASSVALSILHKSCCAQPSVLRVTCLRLCMAHPKYQGGGSRAKHQKRGGTNTHQQGSAPSNGPPVLLSGRRSGTAQCGAAEQKQKCLNFVSGCSCSRE